MFSRHVSLHRRPAYGISIISALVLMVLPHSDVHADGWPNQPDSPLMLGEIQSINNMHPVSRSPDGSLWSAWVGQECFGSLHVQRVDAQGNTFAAPVEVFPIGTCNFREARGVACNNGDFLVAAVAGGVNGGAPFDTQPIIRLSPTGEPVWPNPIILTPPPNNPGGDGGKIGHLLCAPNDDLIVAWHAGINVLVSRFSAAGLDVWDGPAVIPTLTGPTKRIFALIEDEQGDFIVVWDEPGGAYVRAIFAARVSSTGRALWSQPTAISPEFTGSSRHTDPVAISDGAGGVIVVYTEGHEQGIMPMPARMQRVSPTGALMFEPAGRRISLNTTRQFDPVIVREPTSGDVLVFWRDGYDPQSIRAQRMTISGQRVWGDNGVLVKTLIQIAAGRRFDALIVTDQGEPNVMVVVDDLPLPGDPEQSRLRVHRMDLSGNVDARTHAISGNSMANDVRCIAFGAGFVTSWLSDAPMFPDHVVAQRVNADGTIGLPTVVGDVTGDGSVNVLDLLAVINAWGNCPAPPTSCSADANDDGVVNVLDLLMIINNWG